MESSKTSWKIGPPRTLTLAEFEKRKCVSSSSSSASKSPTPVSLPPSPAPDGSQDVSVNDDDTFAIEYSSDEQERSLEDGTSESSCESSEGFESVSDNELNFITIDDDDDDGDTQNTTLKQRVCLRCPTKTQGTIRSEKLYFAHIKRHVFPDLFACQVCKRPFLKLSYCVSHELRVHETPLEFSIASIKDSSAIVKARQYMKNRRDKQTSCSSPKIGVADDEDMDPEDTYFYDNRFVKSTSIYPYKGPPVTSIVQCYEIQAFNPNPKQEVSNRIAQRAIEIHKENVSSYKITNYLGIFSQKKVKRRKMKIPGASTKKRTRKTATEQVPEKSVREDKRCGGNSSEPACKKVRGNDLM